MKKLNILSIAAIVMVVSGSAWASAGKQKNDQPETPGLKFEKSGE